jgi:hypothetical protein
MRIGLSAEWPKGTFGLVWSKPREVTQVTHLMPHNLISNNTDDLHHHRQVPALQLLGILKSLAVY